MKLSGKAEEYLTETIRLPEAAHEGCGFRVWFRGGELWLDSCFEMRTLIPLRTTAVLAEGS